MAFVEPVKSASATTSGGHSGCARMTASGQALRNFLIPSAVNFSWTLQEPCQVRIFFFVSFAVLRARYWPGIISTVSPGKLSTTASAFDEVQQMSDSAFTSAEVFT